MWMTVENSYPEGFITAMMDKESLSNKCSMGHISVWTHYTHSQWLVGRGRDRERGEGEGEREKAGEREGGRESEIYKARTLGFQILWGMTFVRHVFWKSIA